jgi:hypothetical protein
LFSYSHRGAVRHRSRARCAGRGKSQSLKPEQSIERLLLQSVRKVEEHSTLQVFGGCRKECVQGSSLRLEVVRKLRKDKAFETIEGSTRSWCILSD